jgi:hypothetical protein
MPTVIDTLLEYTKQGCNSEFDTFHSNCSTVKRKPALGAAISDSLDKFLNARLDEVRLRYARQCSRNILALTDIDDADYFRQGLLRREVIGDIAYSKQRDHSAHTLYNYLLGWYIFSHSELVKQSFNKHFSLRSYKNNVLHGFSNIWSMVSIVHDIGYLFEGNLSPLNPSMQNRQIAIGAEVVRDYFQHHFWIECKIDSTYDRSRLRSMAEVVEPDYSKDSISSIADSLRLLGSLKYLRQSLLRSVKRSNYKQCNWNILKHRLPEDTFDLWEAHFSFFHLNSMQERVIALRHFFEDQMTTGLGDTGLRMLDHGICSGLLLLQYSTFYFRVQAGLDEKKPFVDDDADLYERFTDRPQSEGLVYDLKWWWNSIVWATAATALHNFVQLEHPEITSYKNPGQLRLEEDPLAYLGILVDIIQEWDRYTVSHESIMAGNLPLQGIDVDLNITPTSKIVFTFKIPYYKNKVIKNLDRALVDWSKIITIN